jgi:hypothetical protein
MTLSSIEQLTTLQTIYIYKSLCPRKKNPQQKKERAAETYFFE